MTEPATVQLASSDFRKAPWDQHFWEWHLECLSKSNSLSLPCKPHYNIHIQILQTDLYIFP